MNWALPESRSSQNTIGSTVHEKSGWYSNRNFERILRRERKIAKQAELPISYVLFDLSYYYEIASDIEYLRFSQKLVRMLSQNTRGCDIKHLTSDTKVGLLLINTCMDKAKILIKRMTRMLYEHLKTLEISASHKIIHTLRISSYLLYQISEQDEIKSEPGTTRHLEIDKEKKISAKKEIMFTEEMRFDKNKNINVSSCGAISLTVPAIWGYGSKYCPGISYLHIKRVIDIICALLFLPAMAIICIAIKLSSKGPVFF